MIKTINSRRSVRKYIDKAVNEQDVKEILEAGMNAPSAGNEQAWHFIVLTDKGIKDKYASLNQNAVYVKNAPVAILVCGNINAEKYNGYYVQDCSAATENMLLAIHSKGMGGVWCTVFPNAITGIKELLNLPENIVPFSVIPFGYTDNIPKAESRYDKNKIHYNKWAL